MHLSDRSDHGAKASQFNRLAIPSSSDRLQIETKVQVHHENAVQWSSNTTVVIIIDHQIITSKDSWVISVMATSTLIILRVTDITIIEVQATNTMAACVWENIITLMGQATTTTIMIITTDREENTKDQAMDTTNNIITIAITKI
jgi:hypothetical protein